MESIEAIRAMNDKHPPGRRRRCIDDLCDEVERLERENKELRDAIENAAQASQEALGRAPPSLASIRRVIREGLPVWPMSILALCDRVEALEEAARGLLDACAVAWTKAGDETMYLSDAELHMGKVLGGGGVALHALVTHARAWAGAIEGQDVAEIERCANELILAVARCGG